MTVAGAGQSIIYDEDEERKAVAVQLENVLLMAALCHISQSDQPNVIALWRLFEFIQRQRATCNR